MYRQDVEELYEMVQPGTQRRPAVIGSGAVAKEKAIFEREQRVA